MKKPTFKNMSSGTSQISYTPAAEHSDGKISFVFDDHKIENTIKLVPHESSIAQWSISNNEVFLDDKIPIAWQKYTSLHESIEKYLEQHYGIPWQMGGHLLADEFEKREWLKSHSLQEWKEYDKTVKFFSHLNEGGKTGNSKINLKRAFDLLRQKQSQPE